MRHGTRVLWTPRFVKVILITAAAATSLTPTRIDGFCSPSATTFRRSRRLSPLRNMKSESSDSFNPLTACSRLSHAMFRVPSVSAAVDYWQTRGARVETYRKDESHGIQTAFVTLGNGQNEGDETKTECFLLEITSLPKDEELHMGNGFQYLGTSMLLEFENNLIMAAAGEKPAKRSDNEEPNGIEVKSVAAAPGDYLSRICLRARGDIGLQGTERFYNDVMGMETVAGDGTSLCLRYKGKEGSYGVPTTLVFTSSSDEEDLDMGNCFDHIVIETACSIDTIRERIRNMCDNDGEDVVFMEPKEMFSRKLMGIVDPNGYKLYLAGEVA